MFKPLIPAIPSKTISIMGYQMLVYEVVRVSKISIGDYEGEFVHVSINSRQERKYIAAFNRIPDIKEREAAIRLTVIDAVNHMNRYVEKNYNGDRLRHSDLKPRYSFGKLKKGAEEYLRIAYQVRCSETFRSTQIRKSIGNIKVITQTDIDESIKEAMCHQRYANEQYNKALKEKHLAFRTLVEQQVKERDSRYGQYTR